MFWMKVCSTIASKRLNLVASPDSVLSVAVRESVVGTSPTEKGAEAPPARFANAARASAMSVGPAARATSRTMSLGGEIAKKTCLAYSFSQFGSCQNKLVAGLRTLPIRPLLADEVQPVAVGPFTLVAAAHVLVGALDHVGARGGRDDPPGLLAGVFQICLLALDGVGDAAMIEVRKQARQRARRVELLDQVARLGLGGMRLRQKRRVAGFVQRLQLLLHQNQLLQPLPARGHAITLPASW